MKHIEIVVIENADADVVFITCFFTLSTRGPIVDSSILLKFQSDTKTTRYGRKFHKLHFYCTALQKVKVGLQKPADLSQWTALTCDCVD